jgi:hypothetical protein
MDRERTDLIRIKTQIVAEFKAHAESLFKSNKWFQGIIGVLGAFLAGAAQFIDGWEIYGLIGIVLVSAIALVQIFYGRDAGIALAQAYEAIEIAHAAAADAEAALVDDNEFDQLIAEFDRTAATYQMTMLMAAAIEQASRTGGVSPEELVTGMVAAVRRMAPISLGFEQADQWTVCVYMAYERADHRIYLKCIAHHRAIPCSLDNAREWQAGTGIAGVALANRNEVVIPDMQAEGLEAVYGTGANSPKPEDAERYRSMAAVPISLEGDTIWGVVTATSDRPSHFSQNVQPIGLERVEPLRALSKMIATGISCRSAAVNDSGSNLSADVKP